MWLLLSFRLPSTLPLHVFRGVHALVHQPRTVSRAPRLHNPPPHLKCCHISNRYVKYPSAKATGKATPFSPSTNLHSSLVANATVLPGSHSIPTIQATAAASPYLPHLVKLSLGWVIDSGASRHYCCHHDELHNLNYATSDWVSGLDVEIRGSGDCYIGLTSCDDTLHTMVLSDVLFVPDIIKRSKDYFHRLLSVAEACTKGWVVTFGGPHGDILTYMATKTSFPLTKQRGLYLIPATRVDPPSPSSVIAATVGSISSKDLLHNRIGRLHDAGISKLASMELPGVPSFLSLCLDFFLLSLSNM